MGVGGEIAREQKQDLRLHMGMAVQVQVPKTHWNKPTTVKPVLQVGVQAKPFAVPAHRATEPLPTRGGPCKQPMRDATSEIFAARPATPAATCVESWATVVLAAACVLAVVLMVRVRADRPLCMAADSCPVAVAAEASDPAVRVRLDVREAMLVCRDCDTRDVFVLSEETLANRAEESWPTPAAAADTAPVREVLRPVRPLCSACEVLKSRDEILEDSCATVACSEALIL